MLCESSLILGDLSGDLVIDSCRYLHLSAHGYAITTVVCGIGCNSPTVSDTHRPESGGGKLMPGMSRNLDTSYPRLPCAIAGPALCGMQL